jgi:hypothetical protein
MPSAEMEGRAPLDNGHGASLGASMEDMDLGIVGDTCLEQ